MIYRNTLILIFTFFTLSAWFFLQANDKEEKSKTANESADNIEITMHDFMEDYVEVAEKKFKKGNKAPLKKILEFLPEASIPENKEEWQTITNKYLESEAYLSSCKACHSKYKKSYKKTYKKRLISVPKEILNFK